MGICFEGRNKRSNTFNQNIAQNMHFTNNYNNMNSSNNNGFINNFPLTNCCCPSCGEPAGINFQGSGEDYDAFNCLKCGKNQAAANYYKCEICYGIFCSQCPKKKDGKLARCPSCGEMAGNSFQGSGEDYDSFDCLKCGKTQCAVNYYKCNVCRGMFCYYCPFDYD